VKAVGGLLASVDDVIPGEAGGDAHGPEDDGGFDHGNPMTTLISRKLLCAGPARL
jgi:hypothetical protein